jgi:hypothetical protein
MSASLSLSRMVDPPLKVESPPASVLKSCFDRFWPTALVGY